MKYYIANSSGFTPYDYDTLLKNAILPTETHREAEQKLAALNAQASEWGNKIPEGNDQEKEAYLQYIQGLNNISTNLLTRGLNQSTMNDVYKEAALYNSTIKPISEQIQAMQNFSDEINKQKLANPRLFIGKKYKDLKLKDFANGKIPELPSINGEAYEKSLIEAMTKLNYDNEKGYKVDVEDLVGSKGTQLLVSRMGMTEDEINEYLNSPDKDSRLRTLITMQRIMFGINDDNYNENDLKQLQGIEKSALYKSLSQPKLTPIDSDYYKDIQVAQGWKKLRLDEQQSGKPTGESNIPGIRQDPTVDPVNANIRQNGENKFTKAWGDLSIAAKNNPNMKAKDYLRKKYPILNKKDDGQWFGDVITKKISEVTGLSSKALKTLTIGELYNKYNSLASFISTTTDTNINIPVYSRSTEQTKQIMHGIEHETGVKAAKENDLKTINNSSCIVKPYSAEKKSDLGTTEFVYQTIQHPENIAKNLVFSISSGNITRNITVDDFIKHTSDDNAVALINECLKGINNTCITYSSSESASIISNYLAYINGIIIESYQSTFEN